MNMCTAWRTPATGGVLAEVRIRSGRYPPSVADRCCGKSLAPACRSSDRRRKHLAGPRESACCAKPNTAVLSGLFGRQNSSRRCRARQSCRPRCASAPAERGPRRKRPLAQIRGLQGPAPGSKQRLRSFCAYRKNAARGQFAPLKACQRSGKAPKRRSPPRLLRLENGRGSTDDVFQLTSIPNLAARSRKRVSIAFLLIRLTVWL